MEVCLQVFCEEILVNGAFTVRSKWVKRTSEDRETPFLLVILVTRMVMSLDTPF